MHVTEIVKKSSYLEDVKAYVALCVDVRMIAGCDELDSGSDVGIARGESERELVSQSIVYCPLSADHGGYPVKEVVAIWKCRHSWVAGHLR